MRGPFSFGRLQRFFHLLLQNPLQCLLHDLPKKFSILQQGCFPFVSFLLILSSGHGSLLSLAFLFNFGDTMLLPFLQNLLYVTEVGALLRREGLYWSNLQTWRKQREEGSLQGLSPKTRGRKSEPRNPLAGKVKALERENRRLQRKLQRAEILLDIQKKASELLEIPLQTVEDEEDD